MRAARGQFLEFELNRLGNALHQRPASLGQGEDDFAALGGQLDEGIGDRLVGNIAGAEPLHAGAPPGISLSPNAERGRARPCAQCLDCSATLGGQFRESACDRLAHSLKSRGDQPETHASCGRRRATPRGPRLPRRTRRLTCSQPCVGIPPIEPPSLASSPLRRPASR